MAGLFSGAINSLKSLLSSSGPAGRLSSQKFKPVSRPKTTPIKPLPALPKFYIAPFGAPKSSIKSGQARNNQAFSDWKNQTAQWNSDFALAEQRRREEQERMRRVYEELERKRKEKQAAFDKVKSDLKSDRTQRAQKALDQMNKQSGGSMLSWKSYLNDDGSIKAKGQKVDGFEIPDSWYGETNTIEWARKEWQKWYNSDSGIYQRTKDQYKASASKNLQQLKKNTSGGFWNWLTGSNQDNARQFSEKELVKQNEKQYKRYEEKLNQFLKDQATKKAAIENARFGSQQEFDSAVKAFSDWETSQINDLEYMRGASAGMSEAYDTGSRAQNTSVLGKTGSWFNKNIVNGLPGQIVGGIWKYTLGEGDENIPSLVTIPSRLINTAGNAIDPNRQINKYGDTSQQGLSGKNAWQASHNQRNWNIGNRKDYNLENDINDSYRTALNIYKQQKKPSDFSEWYAGKLPTKDQWLNEQAYAYEDGRKIKLLGETRKSTTFEGSAAKKRQDLYGGNMDAIEILSDPMMYLGGAGLYNKANQSAKVVKAIKWGENALKASKTGSYVWKGAEKVAKTKVFQTLRAEAKSPNQKYSEALSVAKKGVSDLNTTLRARIDKLNATLLKRDRIDPKVLDDIKNLTDKEAAIIQRMVNGDFGTLKDRLSMKDIKGLQYVGDEQRNKLLDIARRWNDLTEKMRLSDNISNTSYGGTKRTYSPRIDYSGDHDASNYNYRLRKKHKNKIQTADDFSRNAETRYILSSLARENEDSAQIARSRVSKRREKLQAEYSTRFDELTAPVRETDSKRGTISRYVKERLSGKKPTTSLGRSLFNTTTKAATLPTRLWKKSVLTYRPAWTVNNALYNAQGAVLAGGGRALLEQGRMLRPKNWREAMKDIPEGVRADLTGELGSKYVGKNPLKKIDSKVNDFSGGVENWSRVAAFRAAKSHGLSDSEALKRVNRYLFDYKTKNWEKPIKAVMPFWSWNKNLAKAAVSMPFDRPAAAMAYNRFDKHQKGQFQKEFDTLIPELERMGYTADEIKRIKEEQSKYFGGRLNVSNNWINTPFNAFSEKGLSGLGFNPFLSALGESADAKDSFGRDLSGTSASILSRVLSKFPQADLAQKAVKAWSVNTGKTKPSKGWIGKPGSQGYGLTKEKQGYDPSKKNYDPSMDPRTKLSQDFASFFGAPRSLSFDKEGLINSKKLQKVTSDYFSLNTKEMSFDQAEAARQAIFKKYGITPDDFYKGVLSKYDSENTQKIKQMKEDASESNKSLFAEYSKQPRGTRSKWAVNKLKELNKSGYFDTNPFLKSFDWLDPTKVSKTTRAKDRKSYSTRSYSRAWSTPKNSPRIVSDKKKLYDLAKKTGDWTAYNAKYGKKTQKKESVYQYAGKYFKSNESLQKYKTGEFWKKYSDSDKEGRKKLLEENPQYNLRKDWTDKQWDQWKADKKRSDINKARGWGSFSSAMDKYSSSNTADAERFFAKKKASKKKRLTWV